MVKRFKVASLAAATWLIICSFPNILSAATPLVLQISNETAPPGGWAQIKISLAKPQAIATGTIAMDFDPTVFGKPSDYSVFSANGDAWGVAGLGTPHQLVIAFAGGPDTDIVRSEIAPFYYIGVSPAAGMGRLRDLPLFVVNVPVLPTATPGQIVPITAVTNALSAPSPGLWLDPSGNAFDVSVVPGSVTVGGSLSVQNTVPGGGNVPAGTLIRLNGSGFTASTSVLADEVSLGATCFVSPQEIDVTLNAPAELTGKRFLVQDTDGTAVEYFSFSTGSFGTVFPLISSKSIPFASFLFSRTGELFLQNPNPLPADLTVAWFIAPNLAGSDAASVPAGGTWSYEILAYFGLEGTINSSQAVRGVLRENALSTNYFTVYAPSSPPLIGSIVNAASQKQGAVAPGELITVSGISLDLSPPDTSALQLSILIDGQPASIVNSSIIKSQAYGGYRFAIVALTVVVPDEVVGQPWTTIELVSAGVTSAGWGIPVVPAAPAIFTTDSSGVGQAAAFNQDNSVNGPSSPATVGSVIRVLATGCGQPSSLGASIGGSDAVVQVSTDASDLPSSVCQVDVTIPLDVAPGSAVPISLTADGVQSPDGVTISLE